MPDWSGTRAQADALTVVCAWCHAPIGEPCRNLAVAERPPLRNFAAHERRIRDAAALATVDDDEIGF